MSYFKWVLGKGSIPGTPIMYTMRLFKTKRLGIDLHKIVHADAIDCFHTHPYRAIRIVLWGGYVEQMETGIKLIRLPRYIGMINPASCHRIHSLLRGPSYTLWIKGRATHNAEMRGEGWHHAR